MFYNCKTFEDCNNNVRDVSDNRQPVLMFYYDFGSSMSIKFDGGLKKKI